MLYSQACEYLGILFAHVLTTKDPVLFLVFTNYVSKWLNLNDMVINVSSYNRAPMLLLVSSELTLVSSNNGNLFFIFESSAFSNMEILHHCARMESNVIACRVR